MNSPLIVLKSLVPRTVKSTVKKCKSTVKKWLVFGHLAPLVPPEELMHDGPTSYDAFKQNSEEFFRYYVDLCGLKPDERILDVGCGIGRKTIRLTQYLGDGGSYEGIDIVKSGIDWCSERISRRYPRFRFQQIDVYNGHYNPGGRYKATEYRFPYPDGSFDFVVLGSVFTHMLTDDTAHYLSEVARVLRPEGRSLISWFLLNQESQDLVRSGKGTQNFTQEIDAVCSSTSLQQSEQATAYDERYVLDLYARCELAIKPPIHYGSWCGRGEYLSYQDLIVAVKP